MRGCISINVTGRFLYKFKSHFYHKSEHVLRVVLQAFQSVLTSVKFNTHGQLRHMTHPPDPGPSRLSTLVPSSISRLLLRPSPGLSTGRTLRLQEVNLILTIVELISLTVPEC